MRRESSRQKTPTSTKTESFRFAVTLLAALGTILYALYSYLQNSPVSPLWYVFILGVFSVGLILSGGFLFYIVIKAYSIETQDNPKQRNRLEELASNIYSATLFAFPVLVEIWAYFCNIISKAASWNS